MAKESPRVELQGKSPKNICNRGLTNQGVQLEISRGLRLAMFDGLTYEGRKHKTSVFESFILAVREALA